MISAVHAAYVLDASVVAKWFTRHDEPDRRKAIGLRDLHRQRRCRLIVPDICLLEVLNAIRYGRGAEETDWAAALAAIEGLQLEVVPADWELLRKANAIAWAYGVAVYDAAYVALAERQGFPLLTADTVFARRMHGHSIVILLGDLGIG